MSKPESTTAPSKEDAILKAPTISLPKGGGAIRGMGEKFAANPVTGTGSMSVPIATSPGRSGFGPQLSLSYDSGAGNGVFGLGWNLSLPAITRKTDKGLPRYLDAQDSDVFILSGAEDLVPVSTQDASGNWIPEELPPRTVNGTEYDIRRYRPRIEGLFARIELWTNVSDPKEIFWRSISKDNITTWYGKSEDSRIAYPEHPERIFSWLVCLSHDDKGNVINYQYKAENAEKVDFSKAHEVNRGDGDDKRRTVNKYLKRILYGNHKPYLPELMENEPWPEPPGDWYFEAVFDYGEHDEAKPTPEETGEWNLRNDPFSSYRSTFEIRTYRLCQRVLMFHHIPDDDPHEPNAQKGYDGLIRSTDFTYEYEKDAANSRTPIYSKLVEVIQRSYNLTDDGNYFTAQMPPLEFFYKDADIQSELKELHGESLDNMPIGIDGANYQWIDLDGDGLSGLLAEYGSAWYFKRNLSPITLVDGPIEAKFGLTELVSFKPAVALADRFQFLDLAGDGRPDVVQFAGPTPGFYERTMDGHWNPFIPFASLPNVNWDDPNLKFIDIDGDGHADILISEHDAFVWYPSLGENGFDEAQRVSKSWDEEKGPHIVFADGEQSIYLSDMSGDGLSDIVRIRNSEICYWPNLGYGRFGAKVTMDYDSEDIELMLDHADQFDPRRIRLADIDGTGTTDLIYLHREGVRLYFNQSGNSWSVPTLIPSFPVPDNIASVQTLDLLGNGTACLVWSSPLPGEAHCPLRYVDLMGGRKPHLLETTINNLGAETQVKYAPSTKFYLQDKRDGKPWITKLPFPVHVVERVETFDHISRNRFVTRYAYHHGYFDGEEREFRGFGLVEQWDTEQFAALADGETPAANIDGVSHVPPVLTRTWFHTGIYCGADRVSNYFAGLLNHSDRGEYYREPAWLDNDEEAKKRLLPDTILPLGLRTEEEREAVRSLKGMMLRQEVYALDGLDADTDYPHGHPYTVAEQNFTIRQVQPRGSNRHAVFFTHAREAINYHYERNSADPRVQHAMTLQVDTFGNVLRSLAIGYGRRQSPLIDEWDRARQTSTLLSYTENAVTHPIGATGDPELAKHTDDYRAPLPAEALTYELCGFTPPDDPGRFTFDEWEKDGFQRLTALQEIQYEDTAPVGKQRKRLIERLRTLYRPDDCGTSKGDTGALLTLKALEPLALPGESYKLAFTPGLIDQVFKRPRQAQPDESLLPPAARATILGGKAGNQGGYVDLDGDGHWWIPSGRSFCHPDDVAAPVELAEARGHFFQPRRYRDPFGHNAVVAFDAHDLLMVETRDALGNRVTVDTNDYRVLQPRLVSDPNRNQTEVAFDTLGMVVGTAVMGKPTDDNPRQGDRIDALFSPEPLQALLDAFVDNPVEASPDPNASVATQAAHELLANATTRVVYDLTRYMRLGEPPFAATIARETHVSDLGQGAKSKLQISFSYSDGFGREIQKKIQAEPGPGPFDVNDPASPVVNLRWVSSGWTIFNNKGKPVRRYEPFFSKRQRPDGNFYSDHRFEFGVQVGASPVMFYDPAERVVATLHPNHTWEKVVFDPWQQTTYDVNDTVLLPVRADNPLRDADIAGYFGRLPDAEYLPTWHELRTLPAHAAAFANRYPAAENRKNETKAAERAASHADTPATAHFDALGRPFLIVARNRVICEGHLLHNNPDEEFRTRVELDIEGNQRKVFDERKLPDPANLPLGALEQRVVMQYAYDMLGNRVHQLSMEAGARWMLNDVAGKPIRAWDSRGHNFTTGYDALRRPIEQYVRGTFSDPEPLRPSSDPRTLNPPNEAGLLVDSIEYGEPPPGATPAQEAEAQRLNLRTRVYQHSDSAGVATNARLDAAGKPSEAYDFKGNLLCSTRQVVSDYKAIPDWSRNPRPNLDAETFEGCTRYDALNRPIQSVAPRSSLGRGKFNVIQPMFNEANLLEGVNIWLERAAQPDKLLDPAVEAPSSIGVANIDYDAKGQRLCIDYLNGASTFYRYDPHTFRLTQLLTRRKLADFPGDDPLAGNPAWPGKQVQNLHYTYDPAGNITHIHDDAQQAIYFKNQRVEPSNDYTYDALYRLIQATGREHLGQGGTPISHTYKDAGRVGILSANPAGGFAPNDRNAMGRYTERYVYDAVGNFLQMQHARDNAAMADWARAYTYGEASLIDPVKQSNRLSRTTVGNAASERYSHDVHGNMLGMPQLQTMQWDYRDQLQMTQRQKVNDKDADGVERHGERTWYVYDASGQRVRKVTELANNGGIKDERIYLGGFEVFRSYQGVAPARTLKLERVTLHVMDDKQRIVLVEMRTLGDEQDVPQRLIRYQFGNHLGSSSLELDEQAQIISYEEYAPYGSSTYQAVRSMTETAKRYRYTGKERDEESGLYYHGARYYAAWLGRWNAPDPLGVTDGVDSYAYAHCAPITYVDPNGKQNKEPPGGELSMDFEGESVTFKTIQRSPWKKAWAAGKDATMSEPVTIDIDEPLAVGEKGISIEEKFRRATDVENRTFRLSTENRITKWTRTEVGAQEVRGPISLADDPSALFTRRFGDIKEMREVFAEATKRFAGSPLEPVALKNAINGEVRNMIKAGTTQAAREVRAALEKLNWNPNTLTPNVDTATTAARSNTEPTDVAAKPDTTKVVAETEGRAPTVPEAKPKAALESRMPSGMKVLSAAGDALLLGQMATAETPEETHAVLVDAVFTPVELSLKYSPQALLLKHAFGIDPLKLPLPTLPWSERAKFEDAARRHGR
ncbi:SpvB/TcaC N-terminal domain-containing protein [Paenibacillus glycanilyticus]|uniref:SpvB/TcaC N-terminal domain-containing protein n=1 Tax=Paenibacillus glycanilyticus TaxID=126569 RepID=UPI001C3F7871|nr:SpvB/TcaC N-terminal domain-containing protein [Paenibacillus glycanilyticus]